MAPGASLGKRSFGRRRIGLVYPTLPAWNQPAPEWLPLQQAAAIIGVSVNTLHRSISAGKLPASAIGVRLIRVRAEDVDLLYRRVTIGDQLVRWGRS